MGDVVGIARDEVVDGDDAMAFGEEAVDEMGAEEPAPPVTTVTGAGVVAVMCRVIRVFRARGNKKEKTGAKGK